jgi:hypothetical protein
MNQRPKIHCENAMLQQRHGSKELKADLTPQPHYDYHGKTAEELMREPDIKLIKLREFLRELGELP